MRRREKYPDTSTFVYYNANPKGRITGDCLIRATSVATGISYNDVVQALADVQKETGYDGEDALEIMLERIGWIRCKQPRKTDNTKYTGKQFCRWLNQHGDGNNVLANIGSNHIVAFKCACDGKYKVFDIWDSTNGCVGKYWVKS